VSVRVALAATFAFALAASWPAGLHAQASQAGAVPPSEELPEEPAWVMLSGDPAVGGNLDWDEVFRACRVVEEESGEPAGECVARRTGPRVRAFDLYREADRESPLVGQLLIVRRPEEPTSAHFLPLDSLEARLFVPDLYDPDWGYGPPWFHQTLLERRGSWYRLPRRPFPEPVWVELGRQGRDVQVFRLKDHADRVYTALGSLAEREGVVSPEGGTVVVSIGSETIRLRPEEPWDMPCGLEVRSPPPDPRPGVEVSMADLYDEDLHLLLRVRYTRGC